MSCFRHRRRGSFLSPVFGLGTHAPVELILTDFKLLYESVKAGMKGSLLQTNINDTRKIDLKYNQNSFSISFSAINFAVPHRIRYEYRLENHNEEWEHSNSVRNVSYMNLSSGKYVFRLRAFDKYTGQQVGERSLDIVIHNPYWVRGGRCSSISFCCLSLSTCLCSIGGIR